MLYEHLSRARFKSTKISRSECKGLADHDSLGGRCQDELRGCAIAGHADAPGGAVPGHILRTHDDRVDARCRRDDAAHRATGGRRRDTVAGHAGHP